MILGICLVCSFDFVFSGGASDEKSPKLRKSHEVEANSKDVKPEDSKLEVPEPSKPQEPQEEKQNLKETKPNDSKSKLPGSSASEKPEDKAKSKGKKTKDKKPEASKTSIPQKPQKETEKPKEAKSNDEKSKVPETRRSEKPGRKAKPKGRKSNDKKLEAPKPGATADATSEPAATIESIADGTHNSNNSPFVSIKHFHAIRILSGAAFLFLHIFFSAIQKVTPVVRVVCLELDLRFTWPPSTT